VAALANNGAAFLRAYDAAATAGLWTDYVPTAPVSAKAWSTIGGSVLPRCSS